MMNRTKTNACVLSLLLSLLFLLPVKAQERTTRILSEQEFISIVRSFHPVAKQAKLVTSSAKAQLQLARGNFDPFLSVDRTQKTFDGTHYYNYLNPELKIPTWYGIDVRAGMENNSGARTDDQLSMGRSSYIGVNVSLLKGLLMDRRRADVKQAKLFIEQSEQQQRMIINDLLYDAYTAYWNWVKEYQVYSIVTDAFNNNRQRFEFIKNTALLGDRAMMDTIEAAAQLQNFEYLRSDAWMNFLNAGYQLSNFMWLANDSAYIMPTDISPDSSSLKNDLMLTDIPSLQWLLDEALVNHPKLRSYDYKLGILQVEKKYNFQLLLPKVDLKYNVLSKEYFEFPKWGSQYLNNNHRFGFNIAVPLFMREGRGKYTLAKIKIRDTEYEQMQQRLLVQNKIRMAYNELVAYRQQVAIKSAAVDNYRKLLLAENERFREGESSVFLLNSRENKLIEESQKLAELRAKFYKSLQAVQWAAGLLR
jgi:outer membrane protein TolC